MDISHDWESIDSKHSSAIDQEILKCKRCKCIALTIKRIGIGPNSNVMRKVTRYRLPSDEWNVSREEAPQCVQL